VSEIAPATSVHATIDMNATPVAGGSSTGTQRKRPREIPTGNLPDACKLFDDKPAPMPVRDDADYFNDFMENIIF
jgi:hypothetical protein